MKQSDGKQVTRPGATKEDADYDIVGVDLTDEPYTTQAVDIGGSNELAGIIQSRDGNVFSVSIEWQADDGTLLAAEPAATLTGDTRYDIKSITVKSDICQVRVTDSSGAPSNIVDGTLNFH